MFKQPNDYATFTATVKNYGTIKGQISRVTIEEEPTQVLIDWLESKGLTEDDWEQFFSISNTAEVGTTIDPGETNEFTVTVRYLNAAEDIPEGAVNFTITVEYQQPSDGSSSGGNEEPSQPTEGEWVVDNQGKVIAYDPASIQNGVLTVPAVDKDGNHIISVDQASFVSEYNIIVYSTDENEYAIITDQSNYEKLRAYMEKSAFTIISDVNEIPQDETIQQSLKLNLDTSISVEDFDDDHDLKFATLEITTLDLSNATYLTEIGFGCFASGTIEEIIFNNALTTIRDGAFFQNHITSLKIPSSVTTIGDDAFSGNNITTLDLSSASSLTTIGEDAFSNNGLTSLSFVGANNLTTIGYSAFDKNSITSLSIPSSVETVDASAFRSNHIETLDLSHATSLTSIGGYAFSGNNITTLDLSHATSLTSIGNSAFGWQRDKNDSNISTLQSINASNKTKAEYDTMSDNSTWYDDGNSNFHIQYSDQCVGNGC